MKRLRIGVIGSVFVLFGLFAGGAFAQVKIMPLGDSITQGIDGSNPVGGYRDDLDSLLTLAGINFDFVGSLRNGDSTKFDIDHEGHGGWRADEILYGNPNHPEDGKLDDWLAAYSPDIVLLHIGTNDVSNGDPNDQTVTEIGDIIDKIHTYNANTKILLCSVIPRNDDKNSINDNLNVGIEDLFYQKKAAGYPIYYVGQNELFKTNPNWIADYMYDTVHPNNTGYLIMAEAFYNAIRNVLGEAPPFVTDNFNRDKFGITWSAQPSLAIQNNQAVNTAQDWNLAVYKAQINPTKVEFTWGANADSIGIQEAGFALRLNDPDANQADGYLVWIGPYNKIYLWTIVNGVPDQDLPGSGVSSNVAFPKAGDRMRVDLSSDASGFHFDVYVNDVWAGRVSDPDRVMNQPIRQYAGVMFVGGTGRNIGIDDFDLYKEGDISPPAPITDLRVSSVSATSVILEWTAPGDDGNTGVASQYDIRYSTSQITDANFDAATPIPSPPAPLNPGSRQSVVIGGLDQNTTYYFAIKTLDEVPNTSDLSNVAVATTTQGLEVVDTFDRTSLGSDWTADPAFAIVNGQLANTSAVQDWKMAVYNARKNPIEVAFTYDVNAQTADDYENAAILFLDAPSLTANGYMASFRPAKNGIFLWEIVNGQVVNLITSQTNIGLPNPSPGDEFNVAFNSDYQGNHFDYYINGQYYGSLLDPDTLHGASGDLYAGVMLYGGGYNNHIDNFRVVNAPGSPSAILKIGGDLQTATVNTQLPQPLKIRVTDQNGNPVAEVPVEFTVTQGSGSFDKSSGDGNIRVEAESGLIAAPMTKIGDANASGGFYVATSVDGQGSDKISFYVLNSGTYYIWGRVYAPDGEHNSFFVVVDDQPDTALWDIAQSSYNQWRWEKVSDRTQGVKQYNLQSGTHTLKFIGREALSRLDKVLITSDPNYVPSGLEPPKGYTTDTNGEVAAYFRLGTQAGENQIVASSPIIPGVTATFKETGTPDVPANIAMVSGDGQGGKAGESLPAPFVVKVTDQYGNPVPNVDVTFQVLEGGGSLLESQPVKTDTSGLASSTLVLGRESANNRVSASSAGTQPAEIIFTATATSGVASKIVLVSGNAQSAVVNTQLSQPIKVKVLDNQDQPMADFPVNFVVTAGGGSIVETQPVETDTAGIAEAHWILGKTAGTQTVEARAGNLQGSPIQFQATALPGAPSVLTKVSGDSLVGTVNQPLPAAFVVKVADQFGNAVSGDTVSFVVTEGGGHFTNNKSSTVAVTGQNGKAQAVLVLGPVAGQFNNKVQAIRSGLTGSPATFVASANPGAAAKIVYVSGRDQVGYVRQPLPNPLVVKVLDANDNPVANQVVTFTVVSGGGTLNGDTLQAVDVQTDTAGLASVTFWPGPVAGNQVNVVHASANNGQKELTNSPIEFKISAKYTSVKIQLVSGNHQTGVVTSVLPQPLVVKVLDANNQPVKNQPVTFKVIQGGGALDQNGTEVIKYTDASGLASVQLRLGSSVGENNNVVHAIATDGFDPLQGSPVVFTASATASNAVAMAISAGNNQTGIVGKALPQALKVMVTDSLGNGVSGHPVTFRIKRGGGHFSSGANDTLVTVNTDNSGIAQVTLVIGTVAGSDNNEVEATSTDGIHPLKGSPLVFTASGTPDVTDPNRSTVTATSPVVADGTAKSTVTVKLVDQYGNPISGKEVELSVSGSQNFIVQPSQPTNQSGITTGTVASVKAERKIITAKNKTDGIQLVSSAQVDFVPGAAARLIRSRGNEQVRNIGTVLKDPFVVTVTDFYNNPVPNVPVYFEVKSGGGRIVESQPVFTDSLGEASVHYILGDEPGTNLVEAKSGSLVGSPVLFTATGITSPPAKITYISGNNQNGQAGEPLPKPLVVQVLDQNDNPVKNVEVTFRVIFGGGQVSQPQPVLTDAYGMASAVFTLGPTLGSQIVNAEASGLQNSPISFLANASHAKAAKITLLSGDEFKGTVGSSGVVKVQVLDQFDNPVEGYPVVFRVVKGTATITNAQPDTTNINGVATGVFRFGTKSGEVTIQATADGLKGSPVQFHLEALPDAAVSIALLGGDSQIGTLGHRFIESLRVIVYDQYQNPVPGVPVTFVITQGDAAISGNSIKNTAKSGIAEAEIVAGTTAGPITVLAVASGLSGSPVTFHLEAVNNTFPTMAELPNPTVQENQKLTFEVSASDPDGDTLRFVVYSLPQGASFDSLAVDRYQFSWRPSFEQAGTYSVIFEVFDGRGGFDADTVSITVLNVNRKPVITYYVPLGDTTVSRGHTAQFRLEAQDPDDDPLQYFWVVNGVRVADGMLFNFSPTGSQSYTIVGNVTDGTDTVSHTWNIVITGVELTRFAASAVEGKNVIQISWSTRSENQNQGFNLYRSLHSEKGYQRINKELIRPNSDGAYLYEDADLQAGRVYYYKLEDVSIYGEKTMHGPVQARVELPADFALSQNYPNPFNPETTIRFALPQRAHVYLAIYNVLGQRIRLLADQEMSPGYHSVIWDGLNDHGIRVNSGIYYYQFRAGSFKAIKKMLLLK